MSHLNGFKLYEWLLEHRDLSFLSDTSKRTLNRWKNGLNPTIFSADIILVQLSLHPSELPDDLWLEIDPLRVEAAQRVEAGESLKAVARALQVDRNTVRRWIRTVA